MVAIGDDTMGQDRDSHVKENNGTLGAWSQDNLSVECAFLQLQFEICWDQARQKVCVNSAPKHPRQRHVKCPCVLLWWMLMHNLHNVLNSFVTGWTTYEVSVAETSQVFLHRKMMENEPFWSGISMDFLQNAMNRHDPSPTIGSETYLSSTRQHRSTRQHVSAVSGRCRPAQRSPTPWRARGPCLWHLYGISMA